MTTDPTYSRLKTLLIPRNGARRTVPAVPSHPSREKKRNPPPLATPPPERGGPDPKADVEPPPGGGPVKAAGGAVEAPHPADNRVEPVFTPKNGGGPPRPRRPVPPQPQVRHP